MKKAIFTVLAIIAIAAINAQTIPNADFENWQNVQSFENPVNWSTSNTQITLATVITVTKSTAAQHGSYSAKLKSTKPFGFNTVAPGLVTLGQFNLNVVQQTGTVSGGIPWNTRPIRFKGFMKYMPQGGDSCFIGCLLWKHNSVTGLKDTVGFASLTSAQNITSWTEFDIPFVYYLSDVPDSMNIIIMSSDGRYTPVNNSELHIDNLSFEYAPTAVENRVKTSGFFPNPANEMLNIQSESIQKIEIYDSFGKLVFQNQYPNTNQELINIDGFASGIYFVNIYGKATSLGNKIIIE